MLFIFRVDIGSMLNLDMNLALETVANLKTAVASYCNIPVDKQVKKEGNTSNYFVSLLNIDPYDDRRKSPQQTGKNLKI